MLGKEYILKKRKEIEVVMKKGCMHQTPLFGLLTYKGEDVNETRFGFIISKKVSKRAVDRNRIKRLLAEAVRKNINIFPKKTWVVFLAKKTLLEKKYSEVEKDLLNIKI